MVAFSPSLEATLLRAFEDARARRHPQMRTEHILLELMRDRDALKLLLGCGVACDRLRAEVIDYLDNGLLPRAGKRLVKPRVSETAERSVQRACIYVVSAGGEVVTGTHALIALFAEAELPAAVLLRSHLTRFDAARYFRDGIAPVRPRTRLPA